VKRAIEVCQLYLAPLLNYFKVIIGTNEKNNLPINLEDILTLLQSFFEQILVLSGPNNMKQSSGFRTTISHCDNKLQPHLNALKDYSIKTSTKPQYRLTKQKLL
jgi:hypothetical protein